MLILFNLIYFIHRTPFIKTRMRFYQQADAVPSDFFYVLYFLRFCSLLFKEINQRLLNLSLYTTHQPQMYRGAQFEKNIIRHLLRKYDIQSISLHKPSIGENQQLYTEKFFFFPPYFPRAVNNNGTQQRLNLRVKNSGLEIHRRLLKRRKVLLIRKEAQASSRTPSSAGIEATRNFISSAKVLWITGVEHPDDKLTLSFFFFSRFETKEEQHRPQE